MKYIEYHYMITDRIVLFLVGCMGIRLLLVYIANTINLTLLRYMGYLLLLPAIGLFYSYAKMQSPGVGAFGGNIWWNQLRPLHGVFYLLFSYHAIRGNPHAWVYLLADVLFGFTMFVIHYLY